ncbi:hypothetical protein [Sphingomonas oligophenolica]|uniref:Uncharacterized protein n=1 Tax=Sphingomonas oligophenolica TaxID=301154 RepID=A0A502CN24_9SPHN|nr:hypothetical protein [Sphingomonas oligophenolica]TPG13176.1 hypothetical protein EAH84_07185 [Sphingomonas oligophenolica]
MNPHLSTIRAEIDDLLGSGSAAPVVIFAEGQSPKKASKLTEFERWRAADPQSRAADARRDADEAAQAAADARQSAKSHRGRAAEARAAGFAGQAALAEEQADLAGKKAGERLRFAAAKEAHARKLEAAARPAPKPSAKLAATAPTAPISAGPPSAFGAAHMQRTAEAEAQFIATCQRNQVAQAPASTAGSTDAWASARPGGKRYR